MVSEPLQVRAELEGVRAFAPGDVIQQLYDLAALPCRITAAGGHEVGDKQLWRFGPCVVDLRHAQSGFIQQLAGRVALIVRKMLRVVAAAKLIEEFGRDDVVIGKGEPFIDLRRIPSTLQGTACRLAESEGAGGVRRSDHLTILVAEASKDGLFGSQRLIETDITLVGRDRRGKVLLIVVGE